MEVKELLAVQEAERIDASIFGGKLSANDRNASGSAEDSGEDSDEDSDDGIEWSVDMSAEAVAARAEEQAQIKRRALIAARAKTLASIDGSLDEMREILEKQEGPSAAQQASRIIVGLGIPTYNTISIFFFAAFDGGILNGQIPPCVDVLRMLASTPDAKKRLVGCCERLCGVLYPALEKSYPMILKLLYDEDVLEEEYILGWSCALLPTSTEYGFVDVSDEVRSKLDKANMPFITWLQQADEDEEEDEEDEEDEDEDEEGDEFDYNEGESAFSLPCGRRDDLEADVENLLAQLGMMSSQKLIKPPNHECTWFSK
jgi:translation initiation factor 5